MSPCTIAVINTSSPYSNLSGQESLDMALAMSNFAQDVSMFFIDDGVFQLLSGQNAAAVQAKAYHKTFAALEFYDIENLYVCKQSLEQRGLQTANLCVPVSLFEQSELPELLRQHQHVMRF